MATIRWIVMVPGAFLGAWIAYIVVKFGNLWTLPRAVGEGSWVAVFSEFLGSLAMGAACVYLASIIAPTHKFTASVVQAMLVVLACGVLIGVALLRGENGAAIQSIVIIGGAAAMLVDLRRRTKD